MSLLRRLRWYILMGVILLPVLVYGVLVGWAQRRPPLLIGGFSQGGGRVPVLGIQLENTGRFGIALENVTFEGGDQPSEAVVVASPSAWLADNYALFKATADMEHWPLQGWRLAPDAPGYKYAIRAQWQPGARLPSGFVVHYRYLGWPMTGRFAGGAEVTWPETAGAPSPELAAACAPEATAEDRAKLLEKVTPMLGVGQLDQAIMRFLLENAFGPEWEPAAVAADVDGDGQADMLAAFGQCSTPVMVFRAASAFKTAIYLPGQATGGPWRRGDGSRIARSDDTNGDGKTEVVVERRETGSDGTYIHQIIYQWQGGSFATLAETLRKH